MIAPLVSVIIPVYNAERYLAEAVDSVLNQTYHPLEIIVVDDGSTDESANAAKRHPEVRYFYQANQGVSVARNTGLKAAHGEFIAFLDSDDLWVPDKLSVQITFLLEHPHIDYAIAHQRIVLETDTQIPPIFKKELLETDHPGYVPSTLVARKTVFDQIGGFNPEIVNHGEDIEWFTRVKDAGFSMGIIEKCLLIRRMHNSNLSLQSAPNYPRLLRTLKKSIDRKTADKAAR